MSENVMNRMTEEEYRKYPAVNKSALWEMRKSPMHYKWALENPGEDTPALALGRAVHMAVLQPGEFTEHYIDAPEGIDRRTKDGKAAWAEFLEKAGTKEVMSSKDYYDTLDISQAVWAQAREMLEGCECEVPLFWDDKRTGIACKCRVDAMKELDDKFLVIDLKTTTDAQISAFTRNAIAYGYHVQAAHYINGVIANGLNHDKPVEWWFVAVEKKPPYAASVIRMDQGMIDEGQHQLNSLMDMLDKCRTFDEWPGYPERVMELPKWAAQSEEDEE